MTKPECLLKMKKKALLLGAGFCGYIDTCAEIGQLEHTHLISGIYFTFIFFTLPLAINSRCICNLFKKKHNYCKKVQTSSIKYSCKYLNKYPFTIN